MERSVSSAFHNRLLKNILGRFLLFCNKWFSFLFFISFRPPLWVSSSRGLLFLGEKCIYSIISNHRTVFFCWQVSTEFGGSFIGVALQSRVRTPPPHCFPGQDDDVGRALKGEQGDLGSGSHFPVDRPPSLASASSGNNSFSRGFLSWMWLVFSSAAAS